MTDLDTRRKIDALLQTFYQQARTDELLGPVFLGALGHGDWSGHLGTVTDFWCTVLLGESSYPGGFMWKHMRLPIAAAHVDRWTEMFSSLIRETHMGPVTEEALRRVEIMGEVLRAKIKPRGERGPIIQ
ncbi:group III truncated hemoglobin [Neolewinella antarctica]|uniref:Hemoglobin n=1 Tax=Neolewinella antarctica TaxID=442734 RepID=A0ABX0XEX0_9BACT|nr:group III truncated hemoglobin [Neolewinella antarctica]NJC27665.1 hemoglobin [Neolewinella antarctica]